MISPALSCGNVIHASTGPSGFPLILQCTSPAKLAPPSPSAFIAAHQPELHSLLSKYGAILFRGFLAGGTAGKEAVDFASFVGGFKTWANLPAADHLSFASRAEVCDRVFLADEGKQPGMVWRQVQAHAPHPPRAVFYYCETPPPIGCGGNTNLMPSRAVYDALAAEFPSALHDLATKGLIYRHRLPARDAASPTGTGRSWRTFWGCDTKSAAEARMGALGYSWQWESTGGGAGEEELIMVTPVLPAVVEVDGKPTIFTQGIERVVLNKQKWKGVEGGSVPVIAKGMSSAFRTCKWMEVGAGSAPPSPELTSQKADDTPPSIPGAFKPPTSIDMLRQASLAREKMVGGGPALLPPHCLRTRDPHPIAPPPPRRRTKSRRRWSTISSCTGTGRV